VDGSARELTAPQRDRVLGKNRRVFPAFFAVQVFLYVLLFLREKRDF